MLVGRLRIRSTPPENCGIVPDAARTSASPIVPMVRAELVCGFAATVIRVSAFTRYFRYAGDFPSACMICSQVTYSHWPKRRSVLEVNHTSICLAKNASSCGGRSGMKPSAPMMLFCTSSGVIWLSPPSSTGAKIGGRSWNPATVPSTRTRLSRTPFGLPGNGIRLIVSGTC